MVEPKGPEAPKPAIKTGDNSVSISQSVQTTLDLLKQVVGDMKPAGSQKSKSRSSLNLAYNLEKAGEPQKALELFRQTLAQIISEPVPYSSGGTETSYMLGNSLRAVAEIIRLGGDADEAFEQLTVICGKILSPETILNAGKAESYLKKDDPDDRLTVDQAVDLLSNGLTASWESTNPQNWTRINNNSRLRLLIHGIQAVCTKATQGFADAAVLAHKFGREKDAEKFLKSAYGAARLVHMDMKEVMQGNLLIPENKPYQIAAAFKIGQALASMGKIKEAVNLVLDYPTADGGQGIRFLAKEVPSLLKSNPQDPGIVELTIKFLKLADEKKNDNEDIRDAILQIALILRKEFGTNYDLPLDKFLDPGADGEPKE